MKNYFLVGLFGLMGSLLQAQGFGKMQFTIEGGVSDATGTGIAMAKIQVYILPADTLKTLNDKTLIFVLVGKASRAILCERDKCGGIFWWRSVSRVFSEIKSSRGEFAGVDGGCKSTSYELRNGH